MPLRIRHVAGGLLAVSAAILWLARFSWPGWLGLAFLWLAAVIAWRGKKRADREKS